MREASARGSAGGAAVMALFENQDVGLGCFAANLLASQQRTCVQVHAAVAAVRGCTPLLPLSGARHTA